MSDNTLLVEKILTALPQLQCKKCTYEDCLSYAQAVVSDDEDLNKCEPGGTPVSYTHLTLPTTPYV